MTAEQGVLIGFTNELSWLVFPELMSLILFTMTRNFLEHRGSFLGGPFVLLHVIVSFLVYHSIYRMSDFFSGDGEKVENQ